MVNAKVYTFQKQFDGFPKPGDLKLREEELPALKDGEFLAEALYLSVDPYMRIFAATLPLGSTFIGTQVAKIIESQNPNFKVGQIIVGNYGWRTHTISDGKDTTPVLNFQDLPPSLALGVLGMPGNTAYFGFIEICKPKSGETVVVSGAAGAVGSHVGQIAKIKGCNVIGITGSDEKGKWLTEKLGFDHFINYKTQDIEKELEKVAPDGVDCYFDNVGGEISSAVLQKMKSFGRVSVCGSISEYNENVKARTIQLAVVMKQLKIEGFIVHRWSDRWNEGIEQNLRWIQEGKLQYEETITNGFENMFTAFVDMLKGGNVGKAIVKV